MAQEILIIQTAFLGDALLAIPLIKKTREYYPLARITLLARKGFGQYFLQTRLVDHVVEVDKSKSLSWKAAETELKGCSWETVLCAHQSFRSANLVRKLKARQKIGFRQWWNRLFFSTVVERDIKLPDPLRQLALLTGLQPQLAEKYKSLQAGPDLRFVGEEGQSEAVVEWSSMRVDYSKVNVESPSYERAVFLAPGSVWATKRWVPARFIEVGRSLVSLGHPIVLVGSADERILCDQIAREIPGAVNLAGQTQLWTLGAHFAKGSLLICNDNGAMHLGATAGIPILSVFGPTVLDFGYRPWTERAVVVQNQNLKCRPCGRHGHQTCPIGTHECMASISTERVILAARRLL